jgi:hypothetical protein
LAIRQVENAQKTWAVTRKLVIFAGICISAITQLLEFAAFGRSEKHVNAGAFNWPEDLWCSIDRSTVSVVLCWNDQQGALKMFIRVKKIGKYKYL